METRKMPLPGRNDPCPCASGKKYKRCCLGRQAQRERFAGEVGAFALPLLRELGRYATERVQASPEAIAAERFPFWRLPLDRAKASRLLDYLIFDHRAAKYGRSAAAEYLAERAPILSPQWRSLIEAWQDVPTTLFVLEDWSAGVARCRPMLTPLEKAALVEIMPLERLEPLPADGAPVAMRALPAGGMYLYPSWPITFPGRTVEDVAAAITARHHALVRRERIVGFAEFLRLDATAFDEEGAGPTCARIIVPGRS